MTLNVRVTPNIFAHFLKHIERPIEPRIFYSKKYKRNGIRLRKYEYLNIMSMWGGGSLAPSGLYEMDPLDSINLYQLKNNE